MTLPEHVLSAIKSGHVPVIRDWRSLPSRELTRGEKVCKFIETRCVIPEGTLVGKMVELDVFQVAFILAIYDSPTPVSVAILSIARKNAKTATIAFLLLAAIVGPEARLNARLNSGAMSRTQAAEVYNYASKSAALSPKLRDIVKCTESSKTIVGLLMNTEYKALAADAKTAIGGSPALAILDEVGQIKGPQSDFVDAITTAQAAHDNPLLLYISTQAPTDADFFSILIDDAILNQPKSVVCHVYAAAPDCEIMDESQWYASNPALGKFRSLADMRAQADKALRMPSFENTFRNLVINQRVASFATFVNPSIWKSCNGQPDDLLGMRVYGGLDLSSHLDLTALVLVGVDDDDNLHVRCRFWIPESPSGTSLADRERIDKAPYPMWYKQGWITTTPTATIDHKMVAQQIAIDIEGLDLRALAFDRWRIDIFKRACEEVGLDLPLIPFGQGYKQMSPALEAVESAVMNGKLRHGDNPVLNMCAINSVAISDPAGSRKLEKNKSTGRIDGMIALAMAVGASVEHADAVPAVTSADIDNFLDSVEFI